MGNSFKLNRPKYLKWIHLFFILLCLLYVIPMVMIISISLSSEASITKAGAGYSIFPVDFTMDAYRMLFRNPESIVRAYIVTAGQAVIGTVLALLVMGMVAYPLSRSNYVLKGPFTFIIFFTMLFSGGMIPTYIIYTKYYHLGNTFWIYILPGIAGGAWSTLVVRTFFKGLPESLFESAKLDGAREMTIFLRIALPLSLPVFATMGFMSLVGKWNDWNTSLLYIRDENLYTLGYLLQRILNEVEFLKGLSEMMATGEVNLNFGDINTPNETLKYAMCVIAAGPMLIIFPFFQKYFSKGLTIGAVKG